MEDIRAQAVGLLNEAKLCTDTNEKIDKLKPLMEILLHRQQSLMAEFLPHILELQVDSSAPLRRFVCEAVEDISSSCPQFGADVAPVLTSLLTDSSAQVAKHAVIAGTVLFRKNFELILQQTGPEVDPTLLSSWKAVCGFKDVAINMITNGSNDGVRLHAMKLIEVVVLFYTPDPLIGSPHSGDAAVNIGAVADGHQVLDPTLLSQEATKHVSLLLTLLKSPLAETLSGPRAIVAINILAAIARARPLYYGRILPSLLGLVPDCKVFILGRPDSLAHVLKNALLGLLKCTFKNAVPWRQQLVAALQSMNASDMADAAMRQLERPGRNGHRAKDSTAADSRGQSLDFSHSEAERKRSLEDIRQPVTDHPESSAKKVKVEELFPLQAHHHSPQFQPGLPAVPLPKPSAYPPAYGGVRNPSPAPEWRGPAPRRLPPAQPLMGSRAAGQQHYQAPMAAPSMPNPRDLTFGTDGGGVAAERKQQQQQQQEQTPLEAMMGMLSQLVAQGEKAMPSVDLLIGSLPSDMLADIVISYMQHLPAVRPDAAPAVAAVSTSAPAPAPAPAPTPAAIPPLFVPSMAPLPLLVPVPAVSSLPSTIPAPAAVKRDPRRQDPRIGLLSQKVEPLQDPSPALPKAMAAPPIPGSDGPAPPSKSGSQDTEMQAAASSQAAMAATGPSSAQDRIVAVRLGDRERHALRLATHNRIVDSQSVIVSTGGGELRRAIIARLAVQFPDEDGVLDKVIGHIMSDYVRNQGHELALAVLYQLFVAGCFASCTKAKKEEDEEEERLAMVPSSHSPAPQRTYTHFLMSLAARLQRMLPPNDKSLSRLLCEAPCIPNAFFQMVRAVCQLADQGGDQGETGTPPLLVGGDHVNQILAILWTLLAQRPPLRTECMEIVLQCAVHVQDDVRQKAVRLIANRLYQLPYLTDQITNFALHNAQQVSSHLPDVSAAMAQQFLALFFALCTKKHELIAQLFQAFPLSPKPVRQVISQHMPILMKAIGASSPVLLGIIGQPPEGSGPLLRKAINFLVEQSAPSPELIACVKKLYQDHPQEPEYLIPILSWLSRTEVLPIFPRLVDMPLDRFNAAMNRILQGSVHNSPALSPSEVLIELHKVDPQRDSVPLKKVMEVCNACYASRSVFTQDVMATTLNQLVECTPLPKLFMRTTLQALGNFPQLKPFVLEILSRLLNKQIWKDGKLWDGFVRTAVLTAPDSYKVLFQLPAAQFEEFLKKNPSHRASMAAVVTRDSLRSTIPRALLAALTPEIEGADSAA